MGKDKYLIITFGILSFFIPFTIYFITTNPYLTFTDNGELMAVCVTLGIAHPTGYPLFTILGHLWSLLPLCSSKIFQMNLLAAFFTALASFVFYYSNLALYDLLKSKHTKQDKNLKQNGSSDDWQYSLIALISSLTFAFGRIFWGEATSLEVYSLQLILFNLMFWAAFKTIFSAYQTNWTILLMFILGLGFSNHLTSVLFIPNILLLILFPFREKVKFSKPNFKEIILFLLPFLLGVSFYLYLLIRSAQFPEFNWGWVSRSFDKFVYHTSGKQYRVWMFSSADTISENFTKFLAIFPYQFAYVGLFFFVVGVVYLFLKQRYLFYFFFLALASCLFYSLNYQIHDIETYFSLAYISLLFIFSSGLFFFLRKYRYLSYVGILVPLLLLVLNYSSNDESKNNLVVTYTKNVVDNLEPNAVLISSQWDYFCSPFWYLQRIEGYRKDVVLIEKELLRRTWYLEQLRRWYPNVVGRSKQEISDFLEQLELFEAEKPYNPQLIQMRFEKLLESFVERNIDERPVYITFEILQNEYDSKPFLKYEQVPQGFAIRLLRKFQEVPTYFSKINTNPFERFLKKDDHLVQGIIQATITNLAYLEKYYRFLGKNEISDSLIAKINSLSASNQ